MSIFTIRMAFKKGTAQAKSPKKKVFCAHCVAGFGFSQFMKSPSALPLYRDLSEIAGLGHSSTAGKTLYSAIEIICSLSRGLGDHLLHIIAHESLSYIKDEWGLQHLESLLYALL